MEDLISGLKGVEVEALPVNAARIHPRYAGSKKALLESSQEDRRKDLLSIQTRRRQEALNEKRFGSNAENVESETRKKRVSLDFPNDYAKELRHLIDGDSTLIECVRSHNLKNALMLSEWLVEVPPNMEENWVFTLCPVGRRTLVVATQGKTKAFTKMGYLVNTFESRLPGSGSHNDDITVLDCIVSLETRTYFVLDVMCWKGNVLLDCDKECRAFFTRSRMSENSSLAETGTGHFFKFVPLDYLPCAKVELENAMRRSEDIFQGGEKLDGILFYHKLGAYTSGYTPLATWLKPHMLPDILNVSVPEEFLKTDEAMEGNPESIPISSSDMEVDKNKRSKKIKTSTNKNYEMKDADDIGG